MARIKRVIVLFARYSSGPTIKSLYHQCYTRQITLINYFYRDLYEFFLKNWHCQVSKRVYVYKACIDKTCVRSNTRHVFFMEHPNEMFSSLWREVSRSCPAQDNDLVDRAEQQFIKTIKASRKLENFNLESPDKYCISYEQDKRDKVVHDHFQKLYSWRSHFGTGVPTLSWTNIGSTIAGDSYFSAQKDIRFMLDVFTQVPLPPGVRDNEATYIANCFQSVESYFIQQRAPLLSAYVLETDPGDPRWDHSCLKILI